MEVTLKKSWYFGICLDNLNRDGSEISNVFMLLFCTCVDLQAMLVDGLV